MKSETRKSRIPRPKNAAPNTIFTSFDVVDGHAQTIRYSGEPVPVLRKGQNFSVPVAWGYLGTSAEKTGPNDWYPCGSCKMARRVKKALPEHVKNAENLIDEGGLKQPDNYLLAYTAWFEYLLKEAAK